MMLISRYLIFSLLWFLTSCSDSSNSPSSQWQEISGRDVDLVYRAKVPHQWNRTDPAGPIHDTTLSLCEFMIDDIRITIHNFPSNTIDERIPPFAQIERWKRQIPSLDPISANITPQSHGGFVGYLFEGTGNNETTMAFSMQIATEHYQTLSRDISSKSKQMRADYTIKAVGPTDSIQMRKEELLSFARSFELIEEIPNHDD